MEGTLQRKQATKALPKIDQEIVTACKQQNPNFGRAEQPTKKPSGT
jgi:hypothetical protein